MKTILKIVFNFSVIAVLGFVLVVFAVAYLNKKISDPLDVKAKEQIFEIQKGDSAEEIAGNLEKAKIISGKNYFLFYLWQSGKSAKLQAGQYSLSASDNIKEIAEKIIKGDTIKKEISITIPEGFRLKEIEDRLMANGIIKKGELPASLEGYLFPDTYNFSTENLPLKADDVIKKFTDNFDAKTRELKLKSSAGGIDFGNVVIMASILEKEVKTPEDMKIVSGLLWKRIEIGMPLQVDATIAYITGKKTGEITRDDLKIKSPYNTYLSRGLPPAPISNPGLVALEAALNPTQSDYLYYLSKPTGETVFSKTVEEHNRAKNLYLR